MRVEERTSRCPSCGALNAATADWCGQCLRRFTAPPPPPAVETPTPVSDPTPGPTEDSSPPVAESFGPEAVEAPSIVGMSAVPAEAIASVAEPAVPGSPAAEESSGSSQTPPAAARPVDPTAVGKQRGAFKVTETGVTWTCSRCDSENGMEATQCVVCGADLAQTLRPPEPERPQRDPNMTAMISLFMPGAGHIYVGQWPQGIARAAVQLWVLATVIVGAVQGSALVWGTFGVAALSLWAISAHDAYREAADNGRGVVLQGRAFLWVVLGLLGLLMLVVVATAMRAPSAVTGP